MYLKSNKISHTNTGQHMKKKKHINNNNNKKKKIKIFNSAKKAYRNWNVTMKNVNKQNKFDLK